MKMFWISKGQKLEAKQKYLPELIVVNVQKTAQLFQENGKLKYSK